MKALTLTRGLLLTCVCTLAYGLEPISAMAATNPPDDSFEQTKLHLTGSTAVHTSSTSFGSTLIRTMIGLLIVVAVIYALTWVIRQTKSAGTGNGALGTGLEQVASLPLGTNRSVALVRVGDELHLLGVADHAVSDLRVFSEEEAYELGIPFNSDKPGAAGGGGAALNRVVATVRRWTTR